MKLYFSNISASPVKRGLIMARTKITAKKIKPQDKLQKVSEKRKNLSVFLPFIKSMDGTLRLAHENIDKSDIDIRSEIEKTFFYVRERLCEILEKRVEEAQLFNVTQDLDLYSKLIDEIITSLADLYGISQDISITELLEMSKRMKALV